MKHFRNCLVLLLALVMLCTCAGPGLTATALGDISPQATYTLTFYGNGGTDTVTNVPAPVTGNPVDIPNQKPVRSGWTFLGWSTGNNATKPLEEYAPGKTGVTLSYNTSLYAVWGKYTLTYNANGGSGAPAAEMQGGPSITVSTTEPTRSGYHFGGWATSSSAKAPSCVYSPGGVVTLTANTTIYAVWLASDENSVLFNANGGTGGPDAVVHKTSVFIIPTAVPTRSGYDFVGWAQSKAAGIAEYQPGRAYNKTSGPVIFYAQWHEKDASGNLSYSGNVSDGSVSNLPAKQTSTTGKWTVSSTIPTRSGYTFLGWEIGSRKTNACGLYRGGDTLSCMSFTTLFAIWAPNSATFYTVKFDANGGSGAPADLKHVGKPSIPIKIPTRAGYNFLGWSTSSTATTPSYIAGYSGYSTTELNKSSVTLYAVWQQATYTMTFNANGGTNAPDAITYSGQTYLTRFVPTRSGYDFLGWSKAINGLGNWRPGERYSGTSDVTFYAIWHKRGQAQTLKFNANTEDPVGMTPQSIVSYSGAWVIPSQTPDRSGYIFLGWANYDNRNGTRAIYLEGDVVSYSSDLTLYAIWAKDTATIYTVNFSAIGGSGAPKSRIHTGSFMVPHTTPVRDGYIFLGWSESSTATTPTYYAHNTSGTINKNQTLYAVWASATLGTLTFNSNGGTGGPSYLVFNTTSVNRIPLDQPTREGYTFAGWSEHPYGYAAELFSGQSTQITYGRALYAVWNKDDVFTLRYHLNGGTGDYHFEPLEVEQYKYTGIPSVKPTKTGYIFMGWSTNPNTFYTVYAPGDRIHMSKNTDLYAVYGDNSHQRIKVTYDLNFADHGPSEQWTIAGRGLIITDVVPTRIGYRFDGWQRWYNGNSYIHQPGEEINPASNWTLKAMWTDISGCTLHFDANGGSNAPADKVNAIYIPMEIPTRSGYTFVHWNTKKDDSGDVYERNGPVAMSGDMTLYAIWEKDDTPALLNGDLNGDGDIDEADATLILRYAAGLTTLTAEQLAVADLNHDDDVDEADATIILRYAAGLIAELP